MSKYFVVPVCPSSSRRNIEDAFVHVNAIKSIIIDDNVIYFFNNRMDGFEGGAVLKCPPTNFFYTVGDNNAFEGGTVGVSIIS